jgi:hypothetical protein
MNDEQITRLIRKTQRQLWARHFKLPLIGWGLSLSSVAALLLEGVVEFGLFFGGLMALPAIQVSREAAFNWREFNRAPALRLWRELNHRNLLIASPTAQTRELMRSIEALYQTDWRGEVLPLPQAARLIVIYDLQRQRLASIDERTGELELVREQLKFKAARLHQLGDQTPAAATSLDNLSGEIALFDRVGEEVLASCTRLETIVLSVQRAVQVKQLHREIADLNSVVAPRSPALSQIAIPEITDIERQIGREIETFLQLERETDAHLREV